MFKKILSVILGMIIFYSMTACSGKSDESGNQITEETTKTQSTENEMVTVTDHLGNTVEVKKNAERIAVCDIYPLPSVLAVFFNSADKIVGMPGPSMTAAKNSLLGELYPEILNAETGYINGSEVNTEELMKLNPDIVFYSASNPEQGKMLTQAGFKAIAISVNKWDYNCIETLNNWISLLGEIYPSDDKSALVVNYSNELSKLIDERVSKLSEDDKKKSFFLFNTNDKMIMTSGKKFFGQWWADATGSKNVGEELTTENSVPVNMEQVYNWNPDIIFITNFTTIQSEDLYNNNTANFDWSGIDAVKNKQVYKMPLGMYRSYTPGIDTPITLLWMAKTTYPELFSDIDLENKLKEYYKEVFGLELTKEQTYRYFNPASAAGEGLNK